ncbi:phosphate/phosphite/phosphonate ABC transporter substrate-binding protein [Shimia abyssi]|uniref:Phosphonate ABC transporter substrate-binding protein n=1 Tax=Shimia abyssi TaxID=1662395 RepID=A0A2P8FHK7_9RHOB|nr:PhnD/SsuA/transferrin family substrate-binding protein [Shimia abyssi]PSL21187.1 phosphonate ABC transporter substrate-binding protein [Shimia abyssi]
MIASLMMYARPELADAHANFWRHISARLIASGVKSPNDLSQSTEEFHVWTHPNLTLSQTCGMPYRLWLHDQVSLVGTPDYTLPDCPPGYYNSAIIVRADDPRADVTAYRDAIFAYNQTFSQSGYAAPWWHLKPHGFWFNSTFHSGAHLASARAVADGAADIAALDAVSWRQMQTYDPIAARLRVLNFTAPTPGLPLITARNNDPDIVFEAVSNAINDLSDLERTALGLTGLVRIPKERYLTVPNPPLDYATPTPST